MTKTAAVVSIGDELIAGDSIDTNAPWISARLHDLGYRVVERRTAPDDQGAIATALKELAARAGVIVSTGGLGPTPDDLTRQALAQAMGEGLVQDEDAAKAIRRWFEKAGRDLTDINLVQAMRPESGASLPNERGTAPGLSGSVGKTRVFVLPGPPREMQPMFEAHVAPRLAGSEGYLARALHTYGLGESEVSRLLGDILEREQGVVAGTTASGGVVSVRLRAPAALAGEMKAVEARVRSILGGAVFGEGEETLPSAVLATLRSREQTLAVAESCTGGGLGALITGVAGSSDVFMGGWITYSNRLKRELLGVDATTIGTHGAVSAETARAMAAGALTRGGADHALSITGIAGPGGGTSEKPAGTVWIGYAGAGGAHEERRFRFSGDREMVRERAAMAALGMLRLIVDDRAEEALLWERERVV